MSDSALIMIDYINEIVHPEGKFAGMGYPEQIASRGVLYKANKAIATARQSDIPVIFIKVGFTSDYRECLSNSPLFGTAKEYEALRLGSWATEFHNTLDVSDDDTVIIKHRVSGFCGTALEPLLHNWGVKKVYIAGVATDLAVQTTAREAHDRGFDVVILEDLCGAGSEKEHDDTISALSKVAKIIQSDHLGCA